MAGTAMQRVRWFLAAPTRARTSDPELFAELLRLAQRASKGTGVGTCFEEEDVVAELLKDVVEGHFRGVDWRALRDGEARGLLLRRMRQLAVENSDLWNPYRGIRALVARAEGAGLPAPPPELPATIHENGRLSGEAVALAAARLRADAPEALATVNRVAAEIRRRYLPRTVPLETVNLDEALPPQGEPFVDELHEALDAHRLEREMEVLDPSGLALLRQRMQGRTLEGIAASSGAGVTTVHTREQAARRRMREVVRVRGYSAAALRRCLERG